MRCDTHARDIQWCQAVSIHTPTWGVTLLSEVPDRIIRFQSTHLHEVWPRPLSGRWSGTSFNPHTYMRCDVQSCTMSMSILKFQSTHLHEVWPQGQGTSQPTDSFNPHTYMRCDNDSSPIPHKIPCFNPHTYMRCDFMFFSFTYCPMFQSTHLHEVWHLASALKMMSEKFQSTHLHEVWHVVFK